MLLCHILLLGTLLATAGSPATPQYNVANASIQQLTEGFLHWADTLPKGQRDIRLGMPAIDVYSRSGRLLYHGEDAVKNAVFLRDFPSSLANAHPATSRPPLKVVVEMFPEFKRDENRLIDPGAYTIVSYTYVGWAVARPQDQAFKALVRRAPHVRVLEVRVTSP